MNYSLLYNNIIKKYGTKFNDKVEYKERHHIVPKSIGGLDIEDNLVYISARVHFICHRLLCKIYPNNSKLKFAFWAMCNQLNGDVVRTYKVTSHTFNKAKKEFSIVNSIRHKGKKMPDDYCALLSKRMMGNTINPKGKNNHLYGVARTENVKNKIRATKALYPEKQFGFKGYWITPQGKFTSTIKAADAHPTINNGTSIRNFCLSPEKIVTEKMTHKGPFTLQDVGKSLRSLGWDFLLA